MSWTFESNAPAVPIGDGGSKNFVPRRYARSDEIYWGSPDTTTALEPGFYEPISTQMGPALRMIKTKNDSLLRLPDPVCDMLLAEFVDFWAKSAEMSKRGLVCKRGLLLWGPPGSGKTSALQIMAAHTIKEMGGVVIVVNEPGQTARALQMFRTVEPDRPVILIYEDIDALVNANGEAGYLALLDGELQIANVVNVATTNYPELLDRRFTDRPGRFDRVTMVGMPLPEARRAYFAAKAPEIAEEERERWVVASHEWSLAHLRELIVGHLVLGEEVDAVIKRLADMREDMPNSERTNVREFGFASSRRSGASLGRDAAAKQRW